MRVHIAVTLLLMISTSAPSASQTSKPGHGADNPVVPAENYSPQLKSELAELRDAALTDDYAYRQVAHLTDNIGQIGRAHV